LNAGKEDVVNESFDDFLLRLFKNFCKFVLPCHPEAEESYLLIFLIKKKK
jgi:hypothetical protein